jgi:hypothetical protein
MVPALMGLEHQISHAVVMLDSVVKHVLWMSARCLRRVSTMELACQQPQAHSTRATATPPQTLALKAPCVKLTLMSVLPSRVDLVSASMVLVRPHVNVLQDTLGPAAKLMHVQQIPVKMEPHVSVVTQVIQIGTLGANVAKTRAGLEHSVMLTLMIVQHNPVRTEEAVLIC